MSCRTLLPKTLRTGGSDPWPHPASPSRKSTRYKRGASETNRALDAITLEELWSSPWQRTGTETCLAVTDNGPLYFGRTSTFVVPGQQNPRLTRIDDTNGLEFSISGIQDPCYTLREHLRPDGEDFVFLRSTDQGCNGLNHVDLLQVATGLPLWSHQTTLTVGSFQLFSDMAYDSVTDTLCVVGREGNQAVNYTIDVKSGEFLASYTE